MSGDLKHFNAILQDLTKNGRKFTDNSFHPESYSLGGPYVKYQFKRASELAPNAILFNNRVNPCDVKQGMLRDAYFLSALAILAEKANAVERLFLTDQANLAGLYAVWICDNGSWKPIVIDDYLPSRTYHNTHFFAFSQGKEGELWVNLLEKAYAKIFGSYYNIESGLCHYVLRDLTGAPVEELYDEQDLEKVWNFISSGLEKNYYLACGTELGDEEEDSNDGLMRGHAYAILEAFNVESSNGQQRVLKIRNPWNNFEWRGDWSSKSPLWTPELKETMNYDEDPNSGLFYMNLQDYNKYFPVTWVCRYKANNSYSSLNFTHTKSNHDVIRMTVHQAGEVTISLNQTDKRVFKGSRHNDYFYSYARLLIGKVTSEGLEYIAGNSSGFERNLQVIHDFEPGTYIITSEINWSQDYHKSYNLSFYSEPEVTAEVVPEADLLLIQKNIIRNAMIKTENNRTVTSYGRYGDASIQKTVDCIHGIFYFHYENASKKKSKLMETIKFSQISNLRICAPFVNDNQFEVIVLPGSETLVLYKAVLDDYSWGYSASFFIQQATKDDERLPQANLVYHDDQNHKKSSEVNLDYNFFVKESSYLENKKIFDEEREKERNAQKKQEEAAKKRVEEDEDDDAQFFEVQNDENEANYYYGKNQEKAVKSQNKKQNAVAKPPKIYSDFSMQCGQINSKKIRYTNSESSPKEIFVTSLDPKIVYVKNPHFTVAANEFENIRIRFIAPKKPGYYIIKVEVRVNKDSKPDEILEFRINVA